jgi:hypothetical protein
MFAATSIPAKMKMTTEIPPEVTTQDSVETRLGTLRFSDCRPDAATVKKVYDNLAFIRGVDAFLNTSSAAYTLASIDGLKSVGCNNYTAVINEDRLDSKTCLDSFGWTHP